MSVGLELISQFQLKLYPRCTSRQGRFMGGRPGLSMLKVVPNQAGLPARGARNLATPEYEGPAMPLWAGWELIEAP